MFRVTKVRKGSRIGLLMVVSKILSHPNLYLFDYDTMTFI